LLPLLGSAMLLTSPAVGQPQDGPPPLPDGEALARTLPDRGYPFHAHNDYKNDPALMLALRAGARVVEPDIFYRQGGLLQGKAGLRVAHSWWHLDPERNLRNLYLQPLWHIYQTQGRIYRKDSLPLYMMIGFKTSDWAAIRAVRQALREYKPMLTRFTPQGKEPGAVTVLFTGLGGRRDSLIRRLKDSTRYMAFTGNLADTALTNPAARRMIRKISFRWTNYFDWDGHGQMPAAEYRQLKQLAQDVRECGWWVRLWDTPDTPQAWRTQRAAGVHLLDTDRPAALGDWLRNIMEQEGK
jgi:hypothetical protein